MNDLNLLFSGENSNSKRLNSETKLYLIKTITILFTMLLLKEIGV